VSCSQVPEPTVRSEVHIVSLHVHIALVPFILSKCQTFQLNIDSGSSEDGPKLSHDEISPFSNVCHPDLLTGELLLTSASSIILH
jgi:hypothetical protein